MLIRQSIHADIYAKMKRLYGKHVDSIELHTRPIKGQPGKHGYSVTCKEHGVVIPWTKSLEKRTRKVQEHLKGAF